MTRHRFLTGLVFVFCAEFLSAQQLNPFVVSSSGGFFQNESGMLSFTLGEMVAIETHTSASSILTQGFQQNWDYFTDVIGQTRYDFSFCISPNPSDGTFNLITAGEENINVQVRIYDVLGREWLHTSFEHTGNIHTQPLEMSYAGSGAYTIVLRTKVNGTGPEDQLVQKIQVIR